MTPLLHPEARLVDAATGRTVGGPELHTMVEAAAEAFTADAARRRAAGAPAAVVLALTPTDVDAVVRYLGALAAHRPVALLDPALSADTLLDYVDRFRPALVTGVARAEQGGGPSAEQGGSGTSAAPAGYRAQQLPGLGTVWARVTPDGVEPHPDLALLLTTSGSTGDPKLARLSRGAVHANAESVAQSLHLDAGEVAPTTLPLFYTYGLSVLNSHLLRGATVVLERTGYLRSDFWRAVHEHKVTSLAAVPYQYEMLRRLRFDPAEYPSLRTLTQAGGRLRNDLVADFAQRMSAAGGELFVMYGQTEATARMTVLPPERIADKPGSVGLPVPGGSLSVGADDEIVYTGGNVMLGYAATADDLARGDDLGGVLHTGDLGYLDDEGFLFLTGRRKRIGKVFGVRVNLDDVERRLAMSGPAAVVAGDDRLHVFVEGADAERARFLRSDLAAFLGTHVSGLHVCGLEALPLLATGKVDYRALEALR